MTNKTITLSRELADLCYRALNGGENQLTGMEHGRAFRELSAAMASQHVVCSRGILCQESKCDECSGNGSYIPPLADPVPPAGVEPDPIIAVLKGHLADGMNPMFSGGDLKHLIGLLEAGTRLQAELKTALEACDDYGVQVVALRAEVERLTITFRQEQIKRRAEIDALKAKLTKARELIDDLRADTKSGYSRAVQALHNWANQSAPRGYSNIVMTGTSCNQSAPADKCITCDGTGVDLDGAVNPDGGPSDCLECGGRGSLPNRLASADKGQGEPKPTGLSQGWNLTRKHDGFVIGHQSRSPDTKAIEQAERGGYVWVPFLVPEQPAPVAAVLTDDQIFQAIRPALDKSDGGYICDTDKESAIKAGRAVVAALNEVARFNGVKP